MKLSIAPLLTVLLIGNAAWAAKPLVVAPSLKGGKGVSAAIGTGFNKSLRSVASKKARLVSKKSTARALGKVGGGQCDTDTCGAALATATKARFVLTASVTNEDEIYEVKVSLFDSALSKRTIGKAVCELCAADEVSGTIAEAFGKVTKALAAKAPKVAPKPVKKAGVALSSTPTGAEIFIDGKRLKEATPAELALKPGKHKIVVKKVGFKDAERTVTIMDRQLKLDLKLEAAAVVVVPPVKPATPPVSPALQPSATPMVSDSATKYAWGAAIGGALLAGVGTYLIVLDGDLTCDDGRGRTECPKVFNTKGPGIAALGIGAALIGSGVTVLVFSATDDSGPTEAAVGATEGGGAIFNLRGSF